jgi:hypothetical protein
MSEGEAMVAIEYDELGRRVKKHIDTEAPADPNGVDA